MCMKLQILRKTSDLSTSASRVYYARKYVMTQDFPVERTSDASFFDPLL